MDDFVVPADGGTLRLLGDRLVARDGSGALVRRCSAETTMEIIALIGQLSKTADGLVGFTGDGEIGVTVNPGHISLYLDGRDPAARHVVGDHHPLARRLAEQLGTEGYVREIERYGGLDERRRLTRMGG